MSSRDDATSATVAALARGLFALDCHKWGPFNTGAYESLRLHYENDARRFLLPLLAEREAQS